MFDVLVESKSDAGRAAQSSAYYAITALVLGSAFIALFVWSLYSINLGGMMGEDDLAMDTLVAPVAVEEAPPPPPAPEQKPQKQVAQEDAPKNFDVRTEIIQNMNEAPKEVENIKTTTNTVAARREGVTTVIGTKNSDATGGGDPGVERPTSGGGGGNVLASKPAPTPKADDDDAPAPTPTPKPTPKPEPKMISGGVINGKASRLVQPPYPPAAKAVRAAGAVNVQVVIDESGNVISASAVSGHPLLRPAAVAAARASKFSPTLLSGQPVKVSGVIVYNFVAQ